MIVIFECPDGAGKTTLAEQVAEATGAVYIHACEPERHPLVEYTAPLDLKKDYVLDRWHLGEIVYGPLYRGGSGLTAEQFWAVEQYLDERGAIVVLCNGRTEELVTRLRARGEDPVAMKLSTEASEFTKVSRRSILPVFNSPVGMEMTADEVIQAAREQEARRAVDAA